MVVMGGGWCWCWYWSLWLSNSGVGFVLAFLRICMLDWALACYQPPSALISCRWYSSGDVGWC